MCPDVVSFEQLFAPFPAAVARMCVSDLHREGEGRHQPVLQTSEGERLAITKSRHQK
jgi:hypothetical protein